jgi:hypothetical protein
MPKFYRQNKKRIDPRYFLNETTNRDLDEQFDVDPDREEEERAFRSGGDNPFRRKAEGDTEELVQKLLTVMKVPTNFCEENPDHDDCFDEDFLKNMLQNFSSEWPEEVEDEMDLARYLCSPEAKNTEWSWVASEASQLYVQLGEEGKL